MGQDKNFNELPHDVLAEKSLVSSLLIDGQSFDEIVELGLEERDFFHPQFGQVYEAIKEIYMMARPIDIITVSSKLSEKGKLATLGGQSFLADLAEDQASSANIYHYGKTVKDKSIMRRVIKEAMIVFETGKKYKGTTEDFIQEVEARFFKLTMESKRGGMQKLVACLKQNLKTLEDESRSVGEITGLPTGFNKLDEKLMGLQAGQLIVLAARPAMGKSALAVNMAINSAKATGLPVAIFSLEMLAPELSNRMLCSEAKVDGKRIKTKNFLDTDLRSIGTAVNTLSNLPIYINDAADTTLMDIQGQCRKIKWEEGLGMVIVDYLQLMRPMTASLPREQQIAEISRGLKNLAKELECPVMALSQLNRSVETRTDKRPMVSDLRESGSIEQDADIVLLLYRDEVYNAESKDKGIAEVMIGKNRSGEIGTVKLSWVQSYTLFGNLSGHQDNAREF